MPSKPQVRSALMTSALKRAHMRVPHPCPEKPASQVRGSPGKCSRCMLFTPGAYLQASYKPPWHATLIVKVSAWLETPSLRSGATAPPQPPARDSQLPPPCPGWASPAPGVCGPQSQLLSHSSTNPQDFNHSPPFRTPGPSTISQLTTFIKGSHFVVPSGLELTK